MAMAHGEPVKKERDAMLERRSRNGEVDPDEREELWREFAPGSEAHEAAEG
jgi:hypothetical protein